MSYEIVKKENSEITIKATVGKDEFEKAVKTAYNKNKGKFNVPGFRKGRVPQNIIEKQYGEGVFFEDAVNDLLQVHYEKALDVLEINPVARPDIDVTEVGKGQDLIFTAAVTVAPEFTLENYKGLEVEKINVEVTEEMLDTEIEKTRNMNSRLMSVTDRAVQDGDTVIMDYSGFHGEEQFEGGTAENQELVIGSGRFIPGFEEQLVGKELGSDIEVNVTFPEDYHAENLKGQAVVFKVKINEIKFKELPALDDEFAKDISEFDTLAEYRESIRKELEESSKQSAVAAQRDKVLEAVAGLLTVEIPEKMVDTEVEGMLREFDQQLRQQGLSLEQYVQFTGGKLEDLKVTMREDALARVKTGMVIEKVMEQEAIEATDEDVDVEIDKIAEIQKRDQEEVRKLFAKDNYEYLKSNLKSRKTVDFLVDHAKLV
ncbi:trigger factor [Fusibacter sp. 3D3]|uniref:trigger factor n=1 Tax=Fusibacter sp. 3D3 TaxID=1048380 RepID=UPI000853C6DD|nr:trigger factor [Fusibacter sp. 3D3]GAU78248.1 cell division trigger factor [Fusibacter sp. 3D3]